MIILDANVTRPSQGGPSFSLANRLTRLAWLIIWGLSARWTPRQLNAWRCWILRLFGAKVEPNVMVCGSAKIWLPSHLTIGRGSCIGPRATIYNMAPITVGRDTIISQDAQLCGGTHDIRDPAFQLCARSIHIGDRAWIAAGAFVGPGVEIGEGTVLGACACAFENLEAWTVYRGNPATAIGTRTLRAG